MADPAAPRALGHGGLGAPSAAGALVRAPQAGALGVVSALPSVSGGPSFALAGSPVAAPWGA
eukprot:1373285-Alexandrium_andersonii.AAC.1